MKKKIMIEIICFLFIVLFVYAAVNKLIDLQKFRVQIGQSPLLTDIVPFVAWFIPITEIMVAVMLVIDRLRFLGLCASFSLMVMFTAYIIAILQFSENIPCSCGGILESLGWVEHLIFNIAFVILALAGILSYTRLEKRKQPALA